MCLLYMTGSGHVRLCKLSRPEEVTSYIVSVSMAAILNTSKYVNQDFCSPIVPKVTGVECMA